MIKRQIELPKHHSFFLFGPRQTGKSTLLDQRILHVSTWVVDLLLSDTYLLYLKSPSLFREHVLERSQNAMLKTVIVDEIQRIPLLLNEVQSLMRQTKLQFILTGSSARKLKRSGANLLAGRAVQRFLYPFTFQELGNAFRLKDALVYGTLPAIFGLSGAERHDVLKTYTQTYLREEIQQEGIARNIGGFSKFLDIVASQCGEVINFAATARECLLPNKTVQSYYEILEDTLIGVRLGAWSESTRRRLVTHPKFYLFDTGITNAITHRLTETFDASLLGRLFEQWVVLETSRLLSYKQSEARLWYWRTNHGAEVDLLIEKHGKLIAACEIKSTQLITGAHLSGLRSFREEYPKVPLYVISQTANAYSLDHVKILPWQHFFEQLTKWI